MNQSLRSQLDDLGGQRLPDDQYMQELDTILGRIAEALKVDDLAVPAINLELLLHPAVRMAMSDDPHGDMSVNNRVARILLTVIGAQSGVYAKETALAVLNRLISAFPVSAEVVGEIEPLLEELQGTSHTIENLSAEIRPNLARYAQARSGARR